MRIKKAILLLTLALSSLFNSRAYAQSCLQLFAAEPAQNAISIEQLSEIERLLRQLVAELDKGKIQIDENKTAKTYTQLAQQNALINQLDSRLYQRDIIRQNGGLCGTACAVNAMAALYEIQGSRFQQISPSLMQSMVELYNANTKLDARMGTYLQSQQDTLRLLFSAAEVHFPTIGIKAPHIEPRMIAIDEATVSSALQNDSLIIGSIRPTQNGSSYGAHRAHAIIILKLDIYNKKIYLSDPNHPNLVREENYSVGSDGYIYTYAQTTYGQQLTQLFGALLLSKE